MSLSNAIVLTLYLKFLTKITPTDISRGRWSLFFHRDDAQCKHRWISNRSFTAKHHTLICRGRACFKTRCPSFLGMGNTMVSLAGVLAAVRSNAFICWGQQCCKIPCSHLLGPDCRGSMQYSICDIIATIYRCCKTCWVQDCCKRSVLMCWCKECCKTVCSSAGLEIVVKHHALNCWEQESV